MDMPAVRGRESQHQTQRGQTGDRREGFLEVDTLYLGTANDNDARLELLGLVGLNLELRDNLGLEYLDARRHGRTQDFLLGSVFLEACSSLTKALSHSA